MPVALVINSGFGALYLVKKSDRRSEKDSRTLSGPITLELIDNRKLELECSAWVKKTDAQKGGKEYYSLNIGGIPATLFKEENRSTENAPVYSGSFGFAHEMRIAAWVKGDGDKQYLSVVISEKMRQNANDQSPVPADSALPTNFV